LKYALKYFSTSKKLAEADEIIIQYIESVPLDHLIWFATEKCKPEQRLVIDIDVTAVIVEEAEKRDKELFESDENQNEFFLEEISKFADTMKKHPNLAIKVSPTFSKTVSNFVAQLKVFEIPFFYSIQPNCIGEVKTLLAQGVSDIYITEYLAFHLTEIRQMAEGVNIRIYPNVAQAPAICEAFSPEGEDIKKFFIRPEDLDQYEDYVDVIEFFGPLDKQDVLMDIYKDGYWMGGLDELIMGFRDEINCMNLMPDFGFYRLACGHRCDLEKCNYCDISKSLAAELKEKNIYIKKERKDRTNEYNANEESSFNVGAESI
jgi:hypothetical protein